MRFYTSAVQRGNYIYLRGYEEGKRFTRKVLYEPYFFIKAKTGRSEYRTLDGSHVEKMNFDSISEARNFLKKYEGISNFEVYGYDKFVYTFLNDYYPGECQYDRETIKVGTLDIEVDSENGFPDIRSASKTITAITIKVGANIYVFGCGDFTTTDPYVKYTWCKDEHTLLTKFLDMWEYLDIDVVTGWNIEFFDIPYIVNRMKFVLGDDEVKRLSPWNILTEDKIEIFGKEQQTYNPMGIVILDYQQLYKKFTYSQQESYRLDHIAFVEVGEKKLDYSEYESLFGLYKQDYQKFIEYNIKDVVLVDKLDEKLNLMDQAFTIAYDAKINIQDVFTSVRLWDVIIHNYMLDKKLVIPQFRPTNKNEQYAGAYVKDPQTGMHDWVVSFDVTSLYPSLIVQYNLSPETYRGKHNNFYTVDEQLEGRLSTYREYLNKENLALTANGCVWDKTKKGIFPEIVEKMMGDRKLYKDMMIAAKKAYQENPSKENKNAISRNNNMQMARKIQLNSLYGAIGNSYCRWYSLDFAEAITLSGQLAIRYVESNMNKYLNKLLKTNKDYVIAVDTDSNYVNLGPLVKMLVPDKTMDNQIEFVDKICKTKLEPYIDSVFSEFAQYTNAYSNFLKMKRESIANKGIWTAKKRYILNVWDNEGVRYSKPDIKMMGIEAVKSSTPSSCRTKIKEALQIIMNSNESELITFIENFKEEFKTLPFEEVAFPRGCNNLEKFSSPSNIYGMGTPIHVRGALIYNHLLKTKGLAGRYPLVQEGEKIKFCYLKLPNPLKENVISVVNTMPKQLGVDQYIDYDMQFNKAFLDPLRIISDSIGWKTEQINTLEDFFND